MKHNYAFIDGFTGILDVYVKSLEAFLTRPDSKFGLTLVEEQYYVLLQNASTLRYVDWKSLWLLSCDLLLRTPPITFVSHADPLFLFSRLTRTFTKSG